jgi:hypothetical protein
MKKLIKIMMLVLILFISINCEDDTSSTQTTEIGSIIYLLSNSTSSSGTTTTVTIITGGTTSGIVITDPGVPGIQLSENISTPDTIQFALNVVPTGTVNIPISVPAGRQEISKDGITWATSVSFQFNGTNWSTKQTLSVRSIQNTTLDRSITGQQPTFTITISPITGTDTTGFVGIDLPDYTVTNKEDEKVIFLAHHSKFPSGNIDTNANGNVVEELDAICASQATTNLFPGIYKAMFSQLGYRVASIVGGETQIDWVIKPNTVYYVIDKDDFSSISKSFTSDANGLLPAVLDSSFDPNNNGLSYVIITGTTLGPNFTTMNWNNCNNWTNSSAGFIGTFGYPSSLTTTTNGVVYATSQTCNFTTYYVSVACIEQ